MQFIETSMIGVRSAIHELAHPEIPVRFLLVPMVHVAEPSFYDSVTNRLADCTAVVLEGVPGRRASYLTLTYSLLGGLQRMGLCEQSDHDLLSRFTGEVLDGDVNEETFEESWRRMSVHARFLFLLAVPFVALRMLCTDSRKMLGKKLTVTDLPDRTEVLLSGEALEIRELLGGERERQLFRVLQEYLHLQGSQGGLVAILWGARHMPAVWRFLHSLGYRVCSSTWEVVFYFEP